MIWLKRAAAILFSLFVSLGALELLLRAANLYVPPGQGIPVERASYGWRSMPNQTGSKKDLHGEFSARNQTNEHGMNDEPLPVAKPAGRRRIAFFGDSFAEAFQVDRPDNFVERAERALRSTFPEIDLLNFGTGGYGTDQCYLRYLNQGRLFDPDVVVYAAFAGNDAYNSDMALNTPDHPYKPFYDFDQDTFIHLADYKSGDAMTRDNDKRDSRWYRKLHVYTAKREASVRFRAWKRARMGTIQKTPLPVAWDLYRVIPEHDWNRTWEITRRMLKKFQEAVRQDGREFVMVVIPERFEIHPEYWEEVESKHEVGGDVDLSASSRGFIDIARELGIPALDLRADFHRAAEAGDRLYLRHDGHLSLKGHEVAAHAISQFLDPIIGR